MKWSVLAIAVAAVLSAAGCASVTGAALNSGPAKTVYGQGQNLDIAGIRAGITYSNGKNKIQTVEESQLSGYDKHTPGTQTVNVDITNFWGKTLGTGTFEVSVMPLVSIAIASPPAKIKYGQGEELDAAGLAVRGTWEEIGEGAIPGDDYTLSGYDKDNFGNQTVTASFEGKTASFDVTVMRMVALSLTSAPSKNRYSTGERIDLSGLGLSGTFMDGTNPVQLPVAVKAASVSGFDSRYVGRQKVTLTVAGFSVSYDVTVEQPNPALLQGKWYQSKGEADARAVSGSNLEVELTASKYSLGILAYNMTVSGNVLRFTNNNGEYQGSVTFALGTDGPYQTLKLTPNSDYKGVLKILGSLYRK
jgi:hypothetical protein